MRDYKNVTVPKQYRTSSNRTTIKRVETTRIARRTGGGGEKVKNVALQILVVVVMVAGSWLGWLGYKAITHAGMFQIAGVDVRGVQQLNEADLKNIVGGFTNENIFRADLETAVRKARVNPWVKSISIHRSLPNRISMTVVERVPYAILDTGNGKFLIDDEGVIISRVTKENAAAWPLPSVMAKGAKARIGEHTTSDGMGEALKLIAELTSRGGWKPEDVVIKANSPESLSIVYADCEFRIGSAQYTEKLRRLAEIMEDVKRRNLNIAYVDLRAERQAAVMVKNSRVQGSGSRGKGK
jgi:cell division protein FtsQ